MLSYKDQLGRMIHLAGTPERIVSLVPSQTELLASYGLEHLVIGITKFCVHPQNWFRDKTRIGGTKNVDIERVLSLHPDLIIANKEENVKEQVEVLAGEVPVWVSDVNNLEDAFDMILGIGEITDRSTSAHQLVTKIRMGFKGLGLSRKTSNQVHRCAYLIWKDPYITIGGDTFINDMLLYCGLQNVFADKLRYPEISLADLVTTGCNIVFLSSEPYPFREKHVQEIQSALPEAKIMLVDGELFSWYGSRLLKAPEYFSALNAAFDKDV